MSIQEENDISCDECGAYNCKMICLCEDCATSEFASQDQKEPNALLDGKLVNIDLSEARKEVDKMVKKLNLPPIADKIKLANPDKNEQEVAEDE